MRSRLLDKEMLISELEQYIERYCRQYGYSVEEAKEHALVKEVQKYYEEEAKGVVNR